MILNESEFKCKVSGQTDSLKVLDFDYSSSLSKPYICKINFISPDPSLDYWSFVHKNASLSISVQHAKDVQYVSGIISEFSQMGQVGDNYTYGITIEPQIIQLKNQELTDVFLNQNIPDIVEQCLKKAGISHYRFELSQSYTPKEFVCQFQETVYNFIFRWLEYEGIYYYFEHGSNYETLVLTDRYSTHKSHKDFSDLLYTQNQRPLDAAVNSVDAFSSHTNNVAKELVLKGYNYNNDTQTITVEELVSNHGVGNIELFDENIIDENGAKDIAKIRAQGINCMEQVFSGKTHSPGLASGYKFNLKNHFRSDYNQDYLVFEVNQYGSQKKSILSKFGNIIANKDEDDVSFTSYFKAISGKTQFRPTLSIPAKKISGVIPALIDAETSGDTPQLDSQGRYKIRFLYSDKADGQSSDWVRKMESYVGSNYGTHYPVLKGGEACIGFQFGNPDRPIIMGMLHNSSNPNTVTSENSESIVAFATPAGNTITASDVTGKENVTIYSPFGKTSTIIGYNSNPGTWAPSGWVWGSVPTAETAGTWSISSKDKVFQTNANTYSYTGGNSYSVTHGDSYAAKMGLNDTSMTLGLAKQDLTAVGSKSSITTTGIDVGMTITGLKVDYTKAGKTIDFKGDDVVSTVNGVYTKTISKKATISSVRSMSINSIEDITLKSGTSEIIISPTGIILKSGSTSLMIEDLGITISTGNTEMLISDAALQVSTVGDIALKSGATSLLLDCASFKVVAPIVDMG